MPNSAFKLFPSLSLGINRMLAVAIAGMALWDLVFLLFIVPRMIKIFLSVHVVRSYPTCKASTLPIA